MQLSVKKPCTLYIKFKGQCPDVFKLNHNKYGLYYFRQLKGSCPRIKFNLCHPGEYSSSTDFEVVKETSLELPTNVPELPEFERKDIKDFVIVDNPDLKGSPARMFAKTGVIEKGANFYKLPRPIRVFILLHEVAHFYYGLTKQDYVKANAMSYPDGLEYIKKKRADSEKKCDQFALRFYLEMGYNRSMAFYALKRVLSKSQENIDRLKHLANNIQKTQTKSIYK